MTLRASNGVPFLILSPIPAARTGIRVDIYDGANPANLLAVLEDTWERSWTEPLQGPGSGTFKMSALHPKLVADPTLLAYGNIARFNLDDVDRFAISIEHKTHVQAGPAGDVANVITVTGRGVLAKLEEAVAYPQGGIAGDPSRGFAGIAPGHLSRVLIDEAITRGALTGVTRTYTDTVDSNNAPWAVSLDQTERAGTDLLRIHDRMAATAVDVYMKPDLQLWMVNTRGVDRTLTLPLIGAVILQPADNVIMLERSEDGAIRNSILIETPAGFLERTEGASITDHRRREAFLSLGNVSNTDGVDRAADSVFQRSAQPAADIGTEVLDIDGVRPYVDWDVGDYVFGWDDTATLTKYRVRALTVTETAEGRPVFVPELSTITAELEDRLERWLAAMSKGTVGGSAADIAEPVEVTAAVTGAVTDGSATAIADHLAGQPHFDELADLVDVDMTGLAEGDVLYYDTTALKWVRVAGTHTTGRVPTIQGDGTIAWAAAGGGGGGDPYILAPADKPPDTPHAKDDEFSGSSLDAKWTWRNQGAAAATVGFGRLKLQMPVQASYNMRILEQDLPATPYTVTAKMYSVGKTSLYTMGGLGLVDTGGVKIFIPNMMISESSVFRRWYWGTRWNSVTSYGGVASSGEYVNWDRPVYQQFSDDGTTISWRLSTNGLDWYEAGSQLRSAWPITPTKIAICAQESNSSGGSLICDWFRVNWSPDWVPA